MTRIEMEEMVASLLAEQRRLTRYDLELRPDKLMLLKRLLYRLGWNRGVKMKRKPISYARPHVPFSEVKPSWWNDPRHKSGLSQSARILQRMVSSHRNMDVRTMAAMALKGDGNALQALQDKLEDIDDPYSRLNWSDAAEFVRNADRGRGYFYGWPRDMDRIIRMSPSRFDPLEKRIGSFIEGMMRSTRSTQRASYLSQLASSLAAHHDYHNIRDAIQSHLKGGMAAHFPTSLSGDVEGGFQTGNGHNILVRKGKDKEGKPLTWVSFSYRNPNKPLKSGKANWRYEFSVPREEEMPQQEPPTQMSRLPKKLIRYAKVDKDMPAHHLIAGFPLEHFLRHLANDPKNTSTVRDLAYIALTGKNRMTGEVKDDTVSPALWALHDALQESDHPMAPGNKGTYNLMSAADKIHLDKHVHTALREIGEDIRRGPMQPPGEHHWQHRPEHVAMRINHYLDTKAPRDIKERERPLYERVHARVQELAPGTTPKDIDESLHRHAHRGRNIWVSENGIDTRQEKERASEPLRIPPGYGDMFKSEKATRYARLKLSPPKPWKGPMGESMVEHSYHDEAGNKLGVVRVHPRNEGRHLYIHWIGPENAKAGESPNQLGPEAMRSLKEGLKVHYPDAEFISGKRIAGFRKEPEMVVKPMGRLPKKVIRYSHEAFQKVIAQNEQEVTPRAVYADWLEENAPETVTPGVLHRLRNYRGRMWVGFSPKGMVNAIPTLTKEYLEKHPWGEFYHRTSTNSKGRNHRVRVSGKMQTWKRDPERFRVPWKFGLYQSGEFNPRNVHEFLIEDPSDEPSAGVPTQMSRLPRRVIRFSTKSTYEHDSYWMSPTGDLIPIADDHVNAGVRLGIVNPRFEQEYNNLSVWNSEYDPNTEDSKKREMEDFHKAAFDNAFKSGWHRVYIEPQNHRVVAHNSFVSPTRKQVSSLKDLAIIRKLNGVSHLSDESSTGEVSGRRIWDNPDVNKYQRVIRYASSFRGDFIEALRRIQSSNQQALHEVAARLSKQYGMEPSKTYNALYDTPHGATPGIAQAIYGNAAPEHIHAMGAWIGLTSNTPGYAVFHPRPNGPDSLYRFRQEGSGLDIRSKLDRIGVKERVMIPSRKGFDVLIPDKGSRLYNRVKNYTLAQKIHMEASPGHFSTIGSADQARAREMFRNTVVKSESKRMNRTGTVKKYMASTGDLLIKAVNKNPHDLTTRNALADWLEENSEDIHSDTNSIGVLRNPKVRKVLTRKHTTGGLGRSEHRILVHDASWQRSPWKFEDSWIHPSESKFYAQHPNSPELFEIIHNKYGWSADIHDNIDEYYNHLRHGTGPNDYTGDYPDPDSLMNELERHVRTLGE